MEQIVAHLVRLGYPAEVAMQLAAKLLPERVPTPQEHDIARAVTPSDMFLKRQAAALHARDLVSPVAPTSSLFDRRRAAAVTAQGGQPYAEAALHRRAATKQGEERALYEAYVSQLRSAKAAPPADTQPTNTRPASNRGPWE